MRRLRSRPVLLAIALGILCPVLGGVLLWGSSHDSGRAKPGTGGLREGAPAISAKDATLVGRLGGRRGWRLTAERLEADESGNLIHIRKISSGLIYRDGQEYVRFQAGEGKFDVRGGELSLYQGIFLQVPGSAITGEQLTFDVKGERAIIRGNVRIRGKDGEIACEQAYYLLDKERLEVPGAVKLEFDLP